MHSLIKTRIHQMAKATGITITPQHEAVLEYAWAYYRKRRVGPLYNNINKALGVTRQDIGTMFPNGLSSVYAWVGIPVQSSSGGCKPLAVVDVEKPREVYFDNNATTALRKEVRDALAQFYSDPASFGNASSSYAAGMRAYDTIDQARQRLASALQVEPKSILFTGSGSEANNMAIKGIAARHKGGHIISSNVEHPSVLEALRCLERSGFDVTYLPVQGDGGLDAQQVADAMRPDTILVSIMAANNEIGTIYPTAEIAAICRAHGVPFHVDAVQAFGKIPLCPAQLRVDLLTLSGHKINGPKGVAALYVDPGCDIEPLIHGGGQEGGLRAGTENVAGIMALGLAAELTMRDRAETAAHCAALSAYFMEKLASSVPGAKLNGEGRERLSHTLSIAFPGVDSGSLLLSCNQIGVAVSAGSACSAGEDKTSHVLQALDIDNMHYGTIRFSFGRNNSREDIDYLFDHLPTILAELQEQKPEKPQAAE